MGSHGGATAEGQGRPRRFWYHRITMGCSIVASMDTILLGHTPEGLPIYFDRVANASDHIVVVNRIKPHTRLVGRYSGN